MADRVSAWLDSLGDEPTSSSRVDSWLSSLPDDDQSGDSEWEDRGAVQVNRRTGARRPTPRPGALPTSGLNAFLDEKSGNPISRFLQGREAYNDPALGEPIPAMGPRARRGSSSLPASSDPEVEAKRAQLRAVRADLGQSQSAAIPQVSDEQLALSHLGANVGAIGLGLAERVSALDPLAVNPWIGAAYDKLTEEPEIIRNLRRARGLSPQEREPPIPALTDALRHGKERLLARQQEDRENYLANNPDDVHATGAALIEAASMMVPLTPAARAEEGVAVAGERLLPRILKSAGRGGLEGGAMGLGIADPRAPLKEQAKEIGAMAALGAGMAGLGAAGRRPGEEAGARPERRADLDRRARIDAMTPEEREKAIFTNPVSGLGNKRALDAERGTRPSAAIDVDGLKWVNDNYGHEAGSELLRRVGEAIGAETESGYHPSGDEFHILADSPEELQAVVERVRARLAQNPMELRGADGSVARMTPEFSVGYGETPGVAEAGLLSDKAAREAAGLRAGRGEAPPSLSLEDFHDLRKAAGRDVAQQVDRIVSEAAPEGDAALANERLGGTRLRYTAPDGSVHEAPLGVAHAEGEAGASAEAAGAEAQAALGGAPPERIAAPEGVAGEPAARGYDAGDPTQAGAAQGLEPSGHAPVDLAGSDAVAALHELGAQLGRRPTINEIMVGLNLPYSKGRMLWKEWNPGSLVPRETQVVSHARSVTGAARSTSPPPPWLATPPASKAGRLLVKRFARDVEGRVFGARSIAGHIGRAAQTELRVGRTQTTPRNPAHYNPTGHLIRARSGNSLSYVSHEVGHGISEVLRNQLPEAEINKVYRGLSTLTREPGSLASANSVEEGMAEWVRRYVMDPASVAGRPETARIEATLQARAPKVLESLRDGARAWSIHQGRTPEAKIRSYRAPQQDKAPLGERFTDAKDRLLFEVASRRRGIHRQENQLYAAAKEAAREKEAPGPLGWVRSRFKGAATARELYARTHGTEAGVETAYQSVLHIPEEIEHAMLGTPHSRGIRIKDAAGNSKTVYDRSFSDIKHGVGEANWDAFEQYGDTKATLSRAGAGQEYPGRSDGETIETMEGIVQRAEAAHPDWPAHFKEVEGFARALLRALVEGGIRSPEEEARMVAAYPDYWPLYRQPEGDLTGAGTGKKSINALQHRSYGSAQGTLSVEQNMRTQVTNVLRAYYWNRAVLAPLKFAEHVKESNAPFMVKAVASRVVTRLDPALEAMEKVANLQPEEAARIIADHNNMQAWEAATGEKPTLDELRAIDDTEFQQTTGMERLGAGDVNIWWSPTEVWRRKSPADTALNVIVAREGGKPTFLQVHDPVLYDLYTRSRDPGALMKWYGKVFVKAIRPWKSGLTQRLAFALGNIPKDALTAGFMSHDPRAVLPQLYAVNHLVGKLTGRSRLYGAGAAAEGELLAQAMERTKWSPHATKGERIKAVLKEGIVPEGYSEMSVPEKLGEIPGQISSTIMKPFEVLNYVTGQRALATGSERATREGAYEAIKKGGGSDEAAQLGHDVITGNFGESPGSAGLATFYRSLGFMNPSIQSAYEGLRLLGHPDPKVKLATASRLGTIALATAGAWAANRIITAKLFPDKIQDIDERTKNDRLLYMPIAGTVKVPFGFGAEGLVQSYVWNSLDERFADLPPADLFGPDRVIRQLTGIPGGPMDFIPPQTRAYLESRYNFDPFRDKPPEPAWMSRMPVKDRKYRNTPAPYIELSKTPLAQQMEMGPLRIQHGVQAGLGLTVDEAVKAEERIRTGRPYDSAADWPFIGSRLERRHTGWNSISVQKLSEAEKPWEHINAQWKAIVKAHQQDTPAGQAIRKQRDAVKVYHDGIERLKSLYRDAKDLDEKGDRRGAILKEKEMVRRAREILRKNPPP